MSKDCSKCSTPNPADGRFCCHCGANLQVEPAGARRATWQWAALGAAIVVLAACGAWWLNAPHSVAAPSFDAAPPPSMSAASNLAAAAQRRPEETARPAAPTAASAVATAARPPSSDLWEPVGRAAAAEDTPAANARQVARPKAERDARARAAREQRALAATRADADADGARQRLEEARGRGFPAAAAATRRPAPTTVPAPARSVRERCLNLNIVAKAICESRACVRAEHAGELVCQRIRAADDRRREQ